MELDDGYREFLRRAGDHRILSRTEETTLARRAAAGDRRAREELVECNIRLVLSIAQRFRGKGLAYPDLIQEGIVGLHIGIDKFDSERGIKLSTYATWWIRKSLQQAIASAGADTIRIPSVVRARRGKALAMMAKFPDATLAEIAAKCEETEKEIAEALAAASVVASINEPVSGDEGAASMSDSLVDHDADDPQFIPDVIDSELLLAALATLPSDERKILELRFGLAERKPLGIPAIAVKLGKPEHTVSAAQRRALASLRAWYAEHS